MDIKGPNVKPPKVDAEIKSPKIKTPKVEVNVPSVDIVLSGPYLDAELELSEVKGGIKGFFKGIGCKIKAPEVHVPDLSIQRPDVDCPNICVDTYLPNVEFDIPPPKVDVLTSQVNFKKPSIDIEVSDFPDSKGTIKGFFKGLGGKIKAPDVHVPEIELSHSDLEVKAPKVKSPKVSHIDLDVKVTKTKTPKLDTEFETLDANVDLEAPDVKGGIKGFFKGIGGRIRSTDVHIPEYHVSGQDYDINSPHIKILQPHTKVDLPDFNLPSLDANVDFNFSSQVPDPNTVKSPELFYGFDLPMTITNTDWHWSPDSFSHSSPEKRVLQRSVMNKADSPATGSQFDNRLFSFGNYSIIENSQLAANILKNLDIHANNPNVPCVESSYRLQQQPLSSLNLEFELHKAKIRLDSSAGCPEAIKGQRPNFSTTHSVHNNPPGDLTHPNIEFAKNIDVRTSGKSKSTTLFSSSGKQPRGQSQVSSASNLEGSKSGIRSESADSRLKIDLSVPRKCFLHTKPGFEGLGIHIACDKKTRCSPYIYEVESQSPGMKAGLRKNDFILEINGEDVVQLEFNALISRIQSLISEDNLCLTVGNEKAYKKWMKSEKKAKSSSKSTKKN